jgi:hypothetical protein
MGGFTATVDILTPLWAGAAFEDWVGGSLVGRIDLA